MSVALNATNPSAYGASAYTNNAAAMLETVFSAKTLRNF